MRCSKSASVSPFVSRMFEKALSNLPTMPKLWIMYIDFLISQKCISRTRQVLNRALQALPVTQHERLWGVIINRFIGSNDLTVPLKTSKTLLRRYVQLEPGYVDAVISFLIAKDDPVGAVEILVNHIEHEDSRASANLLLLIDLIAKNSNRLRSIEHLNLPRIIRSAIGRYPDKQGELWNALADYYIRLGLFSKAAEIYEESMSTVKTVADFSIIYESHQSFLDLLARSKLDSGTLVGAVRDLKRIELLIDRRDELLSDVLLRQNPNNTVEWIRRTKLHRIQSVPEMVVRTFMDAINSIDPHSPSLIGRVSAVWIEFAKFSASSDKLIARQVFEKAVVSDFRDHDDLAAVWIEWILMELRLTMDSKPDSPDKWSEVLEIARRAVSQYRGSAKGSVQSLLFKAGKLWHLAIDLEQSINGKSKPELVSGLFDAMIDLNVVTPQTILNYAAFETDNLRFERACQILQRGITLFPWPHRRDIWLMYLDLANQRRFSVERMRDLFDQSLQDAMPVVVPCLSYSSFKYELEKGFASDGLTVLKHAGERCQIHEKLSMYYLAIQQAMESHGTPHARRILQDAVNELTEIGRKNGAIDTLVVELCIQYARLETEVNQIERARKVFEHAAQFANPNRTEMNDLWEKWKDFEIDHGSEATYKDMKRVRRSVEVLYSEKHFNALDVGLDNQPEITATPVSIEAAASLAAGIDVSKLRLMAQQRKEEAVSAIEFISASTFEGSKPGFVFKHADQGTGYYKDK